MAAFDLEWQEQRREYIANLTKPELAGRDLRGAEAAGAFLAGIDLIRARLEGASLVGARLEGAQLVSARLAGADLSGTRLEGADLSGASLQSAEWAGASFGASLALAADFTAGRNLTQSQLVQVIGSANTTLPLDAETGEQLYVWTCWTEPPPNFERLIARMAHSGNSKVFRARWRCPPGVAPERTGRPADPAPAASSAD